MPVVFGGQLMGQSLIAALQGHDGKVVKTLSIVFARAGRPDQPLEIEVDPMHAGRAFASSSVTIRQEGRLITRATVLLTADEEDLIRHADPAPAHTPPTSAGSGEWEVSYVGDVDINDPSLVGPSELDAWIRWDGAPDDLPTSQALVAFASDGLLIATAMRPHEGVGQALAHKTISTGVISHTITFHEPLRAGDWLLYSHRAPYAGRGRSYGRADVFRPDGQLVASFVQDNMSRALPEGHAGHL
jgi:acyl-CoA thioesterase